MHAIVHRGLALTVTAAALAAASPALAADEPPAATPVATETPAPPDPVEQAVALASADGTAGLADALAKLTADQLRAVLDQVPAGRLDELAAVLTPEQVVVLGAAAIPALQAELYNATDDGVEPLTLQVAALLEALPSAAPLNALLLSLSSRLAPVSHDGLVTLVKAVLNAAQKPEPPAGLTAIMAAIFPPAPAPAPAPAAPAPAAPAGTPTRITIVRLRRASDGRSAYAVLRGPSSGRARATLTGDGVQAKTVVVRAKRTKVVRLKVTGRGPLVVTATTDGSSLKPSVKRA